MKKALTKRTIDRRPRKWKKVTARVWYKDGYTSYFTFTVCALQEETAKDLANYVERDFLRDLKESKKYGEEYPHGGSVKFKIISCDGQKINRIVE